MFFKNLDAVMPKLETERLILRRMDIGDSEDVFEYASDEEVSKYVAWDLHKSIDDSRRYLRLMMKKYRKFRIGDWGIVLKSNGKLIGSCGFVNWNCEHNCAEIGYVLSRKYWNSGIMTEAVKRVIKFGFEEMNLNRIEGYHMIENVASERVMQKAGMTFEGVIRERFLAKGSYHDVKLYSILKKDFYSRAISFYS